MMFGRAEHDPIALAAAPAHIFNAEPIVVLDRRKFDFEVGLWDNDNNPNCTAVSLANCGKAIGALNGFTLSIDPTKPLAFYRKCIGAAPDADVTQSDGMRMLDVVTFQSIDGYDIGPQMLVGLFGTVQLQRKMLARSLERLGPGWWGIRLYERDMEAVAANQDWQPDNGRDPGKCVGGHAIFGWDYKGLLDDETVRVGTWGDFRTAPWTWLEARLDEAHSPVYRQLERANGTFYAGLTPDDLVAEIT
jgi:hypothetical protein